MAWKEYCAEYWLKELQESMDRYTGDITEILLKMALNTIQSMNLILCPVTKITAFRGRRPYWQPMVTINKQSNKFNQFIDGVESFLMMVASPSAAISSLSEICVRSFV